MSEKRNHVVRYPKLDGKFYKMPDLEVYSAIAPAVCKMVKTANLPNKTLFSFSVAPEVTFFHILIPDGRMFTGAAIKKAGDKEDLPQAMVICVGRAIAVWRNVRMKDMLAPRFALKVTTDDAKQYAKAYISESDVNKQHAKDYVERMVR